MHRFLNVDSARSHAHTLKPVSTVLPQPPDPATVRPQAVLEEAMQKISTSWAKGGIDYVFACSQLKAIRQDLVVGWMHLCL